MTNLEEIKVIPNTKKDTYRIEDINNRLKRAGYKVSRVKYPTELSKDDQSKWTLVTVVDPVMKTKRLTFNDVLSEIINKKIVSVKYYGNDSITVEWLPDGQVDNEDDV